MAYQDGFCASIVGVSKVCWSEAGNWRWFMQVGVRRLLCRSGTTTSTSTTCSRGYSCTRRVTSLPCRLILLAVQPTVRWRIRPRISFLVVASALFSLRMCRIMGKARLLYGRLRSRTRGLVYREWGRVGYCCQALEGALGQQLRADDSDADCLARRRTTCCKQGGSRCLHLREYILCTGASLKPCCWVGVSALLRGPRSVGHRRQGLGLF